MPNLKNIRACFEVLKRYYQRNKKLAEAYDLLHAFLSAEDGYTGGTRFEIEYVVSLNISVVIHQEKGISRWMYQHYFPFIEQKQEFFLSWQDFFHKNDIELGALK
jgi:hypothetical protein